MICLFYFLEGSEVFLVLVKFRKVVAKYLQKILTGFLALWTELYLERFFKELFIQHSQKY